MDLLYLLSAQKQSSSEKIQCHSKYLCRKFAFLDSPQTANYAQQHTQGSHIQPDLPSLFSCIIPPNSFQVLHQCEGSEDS